MTTKIKNVTIKTPDCPETEKNDFTIVISQELRSVETLNPCLHFEHFWFELYIYSESSNVQSSIILVSHYNLLDVMLIFESIQEVHW